MYAHVKLKWMQSTRCACGRRSAPSARADRICHLRRCDPSHSLSGCTHPAPPAPPALIALIALIAQPAQPGSDRPERVRDVYDADSRPRGVRLRLGWIWRFSNHPSPSVFSSRSSSPIWHLSLPSLHMVVVVLLF